MSETIWDAAKAWDHLLKVVFPTANDLPHFAYKVGCYDIDDFTYLSLKDFDTEFNIVTASAQGESITTNHTLSRVLIGKLLRAQRWYDFQPVRDYDTWSLLSTKVLNDFRVEAPITSTVFPTTPGGIPSTPNIHTIQVTPSPEIIKADSSVATFVKSIKRSAEDYPSFQDAKIWFSWHRRVKTKAAAHGCEKVLDKTYVPDRHTEALFAEHQKFMFDMFMDRVQTQRGKQIVRQFEPTMDAQGVWASLCDEYSSGVQAHISGATVEAALMALRCDSQWKSCEKFMNTLYLELMDLEEIRDHLTIPDSQKRLWLITALAPNREMTNAISNSQNNRVMVQIYMDQFIPAGSSRPKDFDDLPFDKYFAFLLDHAKRIDETKSLNTKASRIVNKADATTKPKGTPTPTPNSGPTNPIEDSKVDFNADRVPKETWDRMNGDQKRRFRKAKRDRENKATGHTNSTGNSYQRQIRQAETQSNDSTVVTSNTTTETTTVNPPGSVLRQMLSNNAAKLTQGLGSDSQGDYVVVHNKLYRLANVGNFTYSIRSYDIDRDEDCSLIDGGANGGMAGADMRIIETTDATANVCGIAQNQLKDLPIATGAAVIETMSGLVIGIFHQYAVHGKGRTVHSAVQLRAFGLDVNDLSSRLPGGLQRIATPDGFIIPLSVRNGLAYMSMRPPTDTELETLPHIIFTSDLTWDPSSLDSPATTA
jgi:hypothetical protein